MSAKDLRNRTGIGLASCNEALKLCDQDQDLAYEFLKVKSQAVSRYKKDENNQRIPYTDKDYLELARKNIDDSRFTEAVESLSDGLPPAVL